MKRIVIHWTAGTHTPNATDKKHYHYLVDDQGNTCAGLYTPKDNENCNDGKYAAHTGGGNTGAIGVAMCGMLNFSSKNNPGKYPLTAVQIEACFKLCAELAKKYNVPIENIITHYEFGLQNPKTSSKGKIDVTYLPSYPDVKAGDVGGFIRKKIRWYYNKL